MHVHFASSIIKRTERTHIMKKIICKVEYDTENAEIVLKHTEGQLGDPAGYEETLYVTPDGAYFLYTNGGAESKYAKEDIARKSKAAAEKWLSEN